MAKVSNDEHVFPSTRWEWRPVKIKTPPAGHKTAAAKPSRWNGFPTWPRHRDLTITVRSRGGAESWWLIKARGRHGVFPGHLALEDVMAVVLNEPWSEDP